MTRSQTLRAGPIALGCCIALSPLWVATMFGRGLWTPDEPREADVGWRMSLQSEHSIPTLAGQPILEKPPLAYWAEAAAIAVLPGHDAALRAPNFIYAVLATTAIVFLGFTTGGPIAAWSAGIVSGSLVLALQVASWLATDAAMMCGVAFALLGFYRGLDATTARARLLWYLLMHGGLAWAFMAKGPAAWLVPVLAAASLLTLERKWRELWRWELWIGLSVPASVIGSWLWAALQVPQGGHNLAVMLWANVVGRAVTAHGPDAFAYSQSHRNWPGKYLVEMPIYLLPWTFIFVAASRRAWRAASGANGKPWRFALSALVLPLVALSLAQTARGIYAAPLMLPATLLMGLWAAENLSRPDAFERRMMVATVWLTFVVAFVLLAATAFIVSADPAALPFWPAAGAGAIATALALAISRQHARRGAWPRALIATFFAFEFALLTTAVAAFPAIDQWQNLATIVRAADTDAGARTLALYAADETLVAVVDHTLAPRRAAIVRAESIESGRALLAANNPPVFLVQLPGRGDGPVTRRLNYLGIRTRAPSPSPVVDELTARLGLSIEHTYELPQGRRYALLARHSAASETVDVRTP